MVNNKESLRNKATTGLFWSAFERFGQQGCAFVVQLVLARLLAPEEFGLIAMVVVFVLLCNTLVECGFGRAIVQRKNVDDLDLNTVFYFNILTGCLISIGLCFLAPYIARFYGEPRLTVVICYLSLGVFFGSFGVVQLSILNRNMQFKKLFGVTFPAIVLSGLIGVALAYFGYGLWALVGYALGQRFFTTLCLWLKSDWRPSFSFSTARLRDMFPYASRLAISGLLDQGFQNIYVLVIGKLYVPTEVGYFQRARAFQQLPVTNLNSVLARVSFPLLSSIQEDPVRSKVALRKLLQMSSLCSFLVMAAMAALAEPMVLTLIGDKWSPSVPYLRWLCVAGALYPLHGMNLTLLMAHGRSDRFLRLEIIKKCLVVLNISIAYRYGVEAIVYGMIFTSFTALAINTNYTKKMINYGLFQQIRDVIGNAVSAIVLFIALIIMQKVLNLPSLQVLVCGTILSCLHCTVMARFLSRDVATEFYTLISDYFPRAKPIAQFLLNL
jgi:teichuronic acid exporter